MLRTTGAPANRSAPIPASTTAVMTKPPSSAQIAAISARSEAPRSAIRARRTRCAGASGDRAHRHPRTGRQRRARPALGAGLEPSAGEQERDHDADGLEVCRQTRGMPGALSATPIVMLTAYTVRMAQLLDPHCDILLVGDSLGQVIYGLPSSLQVTIDMMCAHGAAVVRGRI